MIKVFCFFVPSVFINCILMNMVWLVTACLDGTGGAGMLYYTSVLPENWKSYPLQVIWVTLLDVNCLMFDEKYCNVSLVDRAVLPDIIVNIVFLSLAGWLQNVVYGFGSDTTRDLLKSRTPISDTNTMTYNFRSLPFGRLALAGKCLVNEFFRLYLISCSV